MNLRYVPLIVIVLLMAGAFGLGLHRYLALDVLVAHRELLRGYVAQHLILSLVFFALVYVAAVALSLPGAAFLTIGGGAIFGAGLGGAASVVSATIGAILVFAAARSAFGDWLAQRAGPALGQLIAGFRKDAASYMLFLRLVPAFPFALVNLASAMAGVSLRVFAWTTFVGIVPGSLAFSFAGAGIDSVIAAQAQTRRACLAAGRRDCEDGLSLSAFMTRELLLAFVLLGLVALIPVACRRIWGAEKA